GGHGDGVALGQQELAPTGAVHLDDAEQVVPATGVETRGVLTQLVEDLVHLEGCRDGLDQAGCADGAAGDPQALLGQDEDVVPQAGLEVALHLRQVEVGALALVEQALGAVEEVEREVDDTAAGALPVDEDVLFVQVPAAG